MPSSKNPYHLYSTDQGDDLKEVLKKSIRRSKKSITLRTYAITDLGILSLLKKKAEEGVEIHLTYHKKTSPNLHLLENKNFYFHPIQEKGLMHEKIWIIDKELLFLGSTNLTPSSLKMHANLMVGLYAPNLAQTLSSMRPSKITDRVGSRDLLYFSLPNQEALKTLLSTLDQAKKIVKISLFTFTHPLLVEKLIELHERGIKVLVTLDGTTAQGASKKAKKRLEEAHVRVKASKGRALFHHKSAEIDNKIFIIGSANWTKSAFNKNRDFILFIYNK
ncbi:MAG: phosphatidylserine/phosphatidylglycerophosphate/cardiolipin synthase family protein [Simkaniaceae bacterium]|nr:MAG: phosphatidylserine/phosphatidylglycerophosphate/cardiolipin synthase family protein [Simkaniaceae bacterium]